MNASEIFNTSSNVTEKVGITKRIPATPEGMAVAYVSLVLMAIFPIFWGAIRSVKYHKIKVHKEKGSHDHTRMTQRDAFMFPFVASGALLFLYIMFRIFSKDTINLVITGYFYMLGVLTLSHLLCPIASTVIPNSIPKVHYHLKFTSGSKKSKISHIDFRFSSHDTLCFGFCSLVGAWYLMQKHWIANNLFGIAFAINGVEMLLLNNMVTGCILLGGLFIYDIFWVFFTDVMVTVAKSFEAPIKLIFPQDILENGLAAKNFAMLGLGDIVIPGIFIALLLRFDLSLKRRQNIYFYSSYIAYIAGLVLTIFAMHQFNHAQPALLYLVPSCLGVPTLIAFFKGDIVALFKYEDYFTPSSEKDQENKPDQTNKTKERSDSQSNLLDTEKQAKKKSKQQVQRPPVKDKKSK